MAHSQMCPICREPVEYIKDDPEEITAGGGRISAPLDSSIYRCPKHGLLRIYINGQYKQYVERPDA
jgi:hypothetical protein